MGKVCGIYCIENIVNNKKYIGRSVNIYGRWAYHKSALNKNIHMNNYLQHSWNKYGSENFKFYILEECSIEELAEKEGQHMLSCQSYIPTGYNIAIADEETYVHNPITRDKISQSLFGHKRNLGKHHSDETKMKISQTKREQIDDEYIKKCRINNQGVKRKKNSSSQYVGVSYDKVNKKWKATISVENHRKTIGRYKTEIDAALAYNQYVLENFGNQYRINIIKEEQNESYNV
jgi:group I intron endonuclease